MNSNKIKIAETTLSLLKNKNWFDLSIEQIKVKSKIKSLNLLIKNKLEVLKILNEYFDFQLSLDAKNIEKSNNKDMIFEIFMMRFDILQKYRKSILSIFKSFKKNPKDLIFLLPNILDSIVIMIKFTKLSSGGIMGQIKIKGLLIIYISTFYVWISDNTSSLEKTMIALDNYLDKAGKVIGFVQ